VRVSPERIRSGPRWSAEGYLPDRCNVKSRLFVASAGAPLRRAYKNPRRLPQPSRLPGPATCAVVFVDFGAGEGGSMASMTISNRPCLITANTLTYHNKTPPRWVHSQ
jgi:hypothetical protein